MGHGKTEPDHDFYLATICRDEDCPRLDIHPRHRVKEIDRRRTQLEMRLRKDKGRISVLSDVVFAHVLSYRCKRFGEIYNDVINDYGTTTLRSVHRVLAELVAERRVAHVWPARSAKRNYYGVYLRAGSPLLLNPTILDAAVYAAWDAFTE